MNEQNKIKTGKFLSLILRHSPELIGIEMDSQGWVNIKELISKCAAKGKRFSMADLEEIVETNNKRRYSFNEDKTKIRANQGHSIDVDLEFSPVEPPEILYHGTAESFYNSIMEKGIIKKNRQHVHLSDNRTTAHNVGARHGKPLILRVLSGEMHTDGIEFFLSENGVWLTDYIDPKYIEKE